MPCLYGFTVSRLHDWFCSKIDLHSSDRTMKRQKLMIKNVENVLLMKKLNNIDQMVLQTPNYKEIAKLFIIHSSFFILHSSLFIVHCSLFIKKDLSIISASKELRNPLSSLARSCGIHSIKCLDCRFVSII